MESLTVAAFTLVTALFLLQKCPHVATGDSDVSYSSEESNIPSYMTEEPSSEELKELSPLPLPKKLNMLVNVAPINVAPIKLTVSLTDNQGKA